MDIRKKNVLITGASRGIGVYIAKTIVRHGGNVALLSLPSDLALLQDLEKELVEYNVIVKLFAADLSDNKQIDTSIKKVFDDFGEIDIFISNAATESVGIFEYQNEQVLEKAIAVNLLAPIIITRKLIPYMLSKKAGHVVIVSSVAGKLGSPFQSVYSATKAGLNKWALGMQREFSGRGVSFSVISPNYVSNAGMYNDILQSSEEKLVTPKIAGEISPQKIANAVVDAILKNRTDIIVGSPLLRVVSVLNELMPNFISSALNFFKIPQYNKKLAEIDHKKRNTKDGALNGALK